MAVWAYVCRSCESDPPAAWYVAASVIAEMPPGTRIVRVKVSGQWRCAVVDSTRRQSVEQMLVRDAIASSDDDCPACRDRPAGRDHSLNGRGAEAADLAPEASGVSPRAAPEKPAAASGTVQAAALTLEGRRLVVVLVPMELMRSPAEADMAIEALASSFGGVPVVLMAQHQDGAPRYYGDAALVRLLGDIPLDSMPWAEYRLR